MSSIAMAPSNTWSPMTTWSIQGAVLKPDALRFAIERCDRFFQRNGPVWFRRRS